MWIVYKVDGAIVPDLVDRNGERYSTAGMDMHGGKRAKNEVGVDMGWLDVGARETMLEK